MEEVVRTFKLIHTKNLSSFSIMALHLEEKFTQVSRALPWIEPSINMVHLEAVKSFVFGSPLASICATQLLLEHSLRMAISDSEKSGSSRKVPSGNLFEETLGMLLTRKVYAERILELIPDARDREWWTKVKNAVRNKVSHADFPAVFRIAKELSLIEDYAYAGIGSDSYWDPNRPGTWGAFWHRYGDKLAADFLSDSVDQVIKLVQKTNWSSDESWWASQKTEYERFFTEKWDFQNLQESLARVYAVE